MAFINCDIIAPKYVILVQWVVWCGDLGVISRICAATKKACAPGLGPYKLSWFRTLDTLKYWKNASVGYASG